MLDLSVVIPAYNEAGRIQSTIKEVYKYLRDKVKSFEIIVVDDGSDDDTALKVKELIPRISELKLIELPFHQGKGWAVRTGMLEAKGSLVLMTDADLSCPISELEKLKKAIEDGAHLAVGSRRVSGARLIRRQPWLREKIGLAFGFFTRRIIPTGIMDTQCGFKCFKKEVAEKLFSLQTSSGFCFDLEILALARRLGYRIAEVPVVWEHSPDSRVKPFRHLPQVIWEVVKIRWKLWRRKDFEKSS